MQKVLIIGGSGLIGKYLLPKLKDLGFYTILSSREPSRVKSNFADEIVKFTDTNTTEVAEKIKDCDFIINLAGVSVSDEKWNDTFKNILYKSRVDTTNNLVELINKCDCKSKVLINASAIGFYGDCGSVNLHENSDHGNGFLADLVIKWETAALRCNARVVLLRIGLVLAKNGGALNKMITPYKFGIGGTLGSGNQFVSWIHIDDLINLILFSMHNSEIYGPINCVSPNPVKMKEFSKTLGNVLNRPSIFMVPSFILKLIMGESASIVLNSQKVLPEKALNNSFKFNFIDIYTALNDLLRKNK